MNARYRFWRQVSRARVLNVLKSTRQATEIADAAHVIIETGGFGPKGRQDDTFASIGPLAGVENGEVSDEEVNVCFGTTVNTVQENTR